MSAASKWTGSEPNLMRGFKTVILISPLALLMACGGVPRTYYYTLRPPVAPAAPGDPQTPFVLGIEHFHAPVALRDDRIVYYDSPTEMNYYEFSRWSSDPATLLTEQCGRSLRSMGVFLEVRLLPSREPVDYILRGRVLSFEEVDFERQGQGSAGTFSGPGSRPQNDLARRTRKLCTIPGQRDGGRSRRPEHCQRAGVTG